MLLAEQPLAGLERAPKERLRVLIAALGLIEEGEIVHGGKRVGMLLAEHPLGKRDGFLRERERLLVFSLAVELHSAVVEDDDVVCTLRHAHGSAGGEDRNDQDFDDNAPEPCLPHASAPQTANGNARAIR